LTKLQSQHDALQEIRLAAAAAAHSSNAPAHALSWIATGMTQFVQVKFFRYVCLQGIDRRERLRRLALETIDLAKDPYYMRNHLGQV
jgi:hypothetical protein